MLEMMRQTFTEFANRSASLPTHTPSAAEVSSPVESTRRITLGIPNTLPHGVNFQTMESTDSNVRTPFTAPANTANTSTGTAGVIGKHPIYAFTNKPAATVVLTKDIRYDTWRYYLNLALQSTGLLYLVDPSVPPPVSPNDPTVALHKVRFCEHVGN